MSADWCCSYCPNTLTVPCPALTTCNFQVSANATVELLAPSPGFESDWDGHCDPGTCTCSYDSFDALEECGSYGIQSAVHFHVDWVYNPCAHNLPEDCDCGNGVLDGLEPCDDGNLIDGDGCSDQCYIETGWTCSGFPSVCVPI